MFSKTVSPKMFEQMQTDKSRLQEQATSTYCNAIQCKLCKKRCLCEASSSRCSCCFAKKTRDYSLCTSGSLLVFLIVMQAPVSSASACYGWVLTDGFHECSCNCAFSQNHAFFPSVEYFQNSLQTPATFMSLMTFVFMFCFYPHIVFNLLLLFYSKPLLCTSSSVPAWRVCL